MSHAPHSLRRVVIPHEHGGWAFLAEPVVLGNLVAFSLPGVLIGFAALAAFLARQPLVLWLSDRRRGTRYPRTVVAEGAFAVLALAAAAALAAAVALGRGPVMFAVTRAAPLAAAALAFDLSRRSRALAAELTGALALAGAAAAIALAGGWSLAPSLGLWGMLGARAISTVGYVRARLRLDRGERPSLAAALGAQLAALGAAIALARLGVAPWLGVAAMALLALRAAHGLSPWRPRMKTWQLGASEVGFGALTVAALAIGARSAP